MGSNEGSIEVELRREIALRRAIERSMQAGVAAIDRDGVQIYVNRAFAEMVGWSIEELTGARPPYRYWPPEEIGAIEGAFARTLAGDVPEGGFELRFAKKSGARFDVLVHISPLREAQEVPRGWLASVHDVTARKRAEEKQRLLADAAPILASSLDIEECLRGLARLAVPRFADMCSVHLLREDGSLAPVEIAHADPEKAQLAWQVERRWPAPMNAPRGRPLVVRTGRSTLQARVDPSGADAVSDPHRSLLRALELRSVLIVPLEARGRVLGTLSFATAGPSARELDAADLGAAEELASRVALAIDNARLYEEAERARVEAERAAARLRVLAEASETLALSLDDDTALRTLARLTVAHLADYAVSYSLNADGSLRRAGIAHREPGLQALVEELDRAGAPRTDDAFGAGAVIRTGAPVIASEIPPEMLERAAQNEAHLAVLRQLAPRSSILVPLIARGRTLGALALAATDASGRRYSNDDLVLAEELAGRAALLVDNARLYREAQQALRAREEMVAVVSHDLRSPLQVIGTSTALLAMPDLSADKHARAIAAAGRAVQQMERFVRELLDLARIDAGALAIERGEVDLAALVLESVTVLTTIAEERSVRLEVAPIGELPRVSGDAGGLRQVLANIVGNALELAPRGGHVTVSAWTAEGEVRVAVRDDGPGIAEEQLPFLFDRFWQGDRSGRRGTGLGLTIAKGIVDAHGGTIRVESRVGEGSTFEIALPIAAPERAS